MPAGPGEIRVNFAALETAAGELETAAGELNTYLTDLNSRLNPLFELWSGDANLGFAQVQAEWNGAQEQMNGVLHTISLALQDAKDGYVHTETFNANMWNR